MPDTKFESPTLIDIGHSDEESEPSSYSPKPSETPEPIESKEPDSSLDSSSNKSNSSYGSYSLASALFGRLFNHSEKRSKHSSPSSGPHSNYTSRNNSSHSLKFDPPPLSPINLVGYRNNTKTRLMTRALAEEIRVLFPERKQLYDVWTLVYSLEQHGASLSTLYANCASSSYSEKGSLSPHPYVLVVKDEMGNKFGAYVNESFKRSALANGPSRFYGTGDCFLWKVREIKPEPLVSSSARKEVQHDTQNTQDVGYELLIKGFPYTGVNDFVIYCTSQYLSLGGGDGHYGLWLDDSLDRGVSSHSLTFGNEPLSEMGTNFNIMGVEVWKIG